jgi:hypothetical protein
VAHSDPLITVFGAVFELVKVVAATPYELAVPSDGAVAANTATGPARPTTKEKANAIPIKFLLNIFIFYFYFIKSLFII